MSRSFVCHTVVRMILCSFYLQTIQALEGCFRVYYPDSTWGTFAVTPEATALELCRTILIRRSLSSNTPSSLLLVLQFKDRTVQRALADAEHPLEVVRENASHNPSFRNAHIRYRPFRFKDQSSTNRAPLLRSNPSSEGGTVSSGDVAVQPRVSSNKLIECGYLEVLEGRRWTHRWFSVEDGILSWYKRSSSQRPRGQVSLDNAIVRMLSSMPEINDSVFPSSPSHQSKIPLTKDSSISPRKSTRPSSTASSQPGLVSKEGAYSIIEVLLPCRRLLLRHTSSEVVEMWIDTLTLFSKQLDIFNRHFGHAQHLVDEGEARAADEAESAFMNEFSSLRAVISNERSLKVFIDFTMRTHSEESILFWIAVQHYKSGEFSEDDSRLLLRHIYDTYIRAGSHQEVSTGSVKRREIERIVENDILDKHRIAFDDILGDILTTMEHTTFPAFMQSREVRKVLYTSDASKCSGTMPIVPQLKMTPRSDFSLRELTLSSYDDTLSLCSSRCSTSETSIENDSPEIFSRSSLLSSPMILPSNVVRSSPMHPYSHAPIAAPDRLVMSTADGAFHSSPDIIRHSSWQCLYNMNDADSLILS